MNKKGKKLVVELVIIFIGCVMLAIGIDLFLVPNKIVSGGVSGLATVIYYMSDKQLPLGMIMLVLNIPLFIFGWRLLGRYFAIKSLIGTLLLSLVIDGVNPFVEDFFNNYIAKTDTSTDLLLYTVFGGVFIGVGLGLIFRVGATTGGSDLLAAIIRHRFTNFSNGQILMVVDIVVVLVAMIYFKSFLLGLYAIISLFIISKVMDAVLEGINFSKAIFIISDKSELIAKRILNELDRGATAFHGAGMYTKKEKDILLCVINRGEIPKLKTYIKEIDPQAFVIMTDIREVLGEGFRPLV